MDLSAVVEALPDIADHLVVEIGCGTGQLVDHLASRAARVLGVDLSAGMLAVAAGRISGRLVRADARHLPLPDGVADAAVTVATLEFADAATVRGELARITRPGGRVVVVTLNPDSLWGLLDRPTRREPFSSGTYQLAGSSKVEWRVPSVSMSSVMPRASRQVLQQPMSAPCWHTK